MPAAMVLLAQLVTPLRVGAQMRPAAPAWPTGVEIVMRNRAFLIPESVVQGLPMQPTLGVHWWPRPHWRLSIDAQTVDNSGPGVQGTWAVDRTVPGGGSGNFLQEITVEGAYRTPLRSTAWWIELGTSWSRAVRSYNAVERTSGERFGGNRQRGVATASADVMRGGARGRWSMGAVVAALARSDAMYVRALPGETRRFGPLIGVRTSVGAPVVGRLAGWGRVAAPLAGRNSISRHTGRPTRTLVYDAGLTLRLSRHTSGELFISNALGNTGALSLVGDREYRALGAGLRFDAGARADAARMRGGVEWVEVPTPLASRSLSPPWARGGAVTAHVRLGGQGATASAEVAPIAGLQVGAFLDLPRGRRDEGELGAILRLGLLEMSSRPGRIALIVSGSRTNNPLVNLLAADARELDRLGLPKGGFRFGDEDAREGRLYVLAGAIAADLRAGRTRFLVAPTAGYVQRNGVQLAGVALGADRRLHDAWRVAVDAGVPIARRNVVLVGRRAYAVPWRVGLEWEPRGSSGRGIVALETFVTNRVGDSPFHALRVRSGREVTIGAGARFRAP